MIWFWDEGTFGLTEEKKINAVRFFFFYFFFHFIYLPLISLSSALVMYAIRVLLPDSDSYSSLGPFFFAPFLYIQHPSIVVFLICSLPPVLLCVDSLSRYTSSFHFINIRNPNVYTEHELSSSPPLVLRHQ